MPIEKTNDPTQSIKLCHGLIRKLIDAQHSLQKWHAVAQKVSGNPAANTLHGQGRILALLATQDEMRQRDICKELGIRPQSLGEMLAKLEKAGLIERRSIGASNHALAVKITQTGRETLEECPRISSFSGFTDEELIQCANYLERIATEIDAQREELSQP
ncbi:MAG: MarR family transcriptional regulator [Collinsella sp.]|nr:MarR family transcriptional regulator [Collinsella sp.]